jgi:uncharacterized protein
VSNASRSAWSAEVRETHSAVVMLLGERAYKFKKPVDLGFLDFRSAANRRRACKREVDLNRRLAPDVYLDLVTIRGPGRHTYEYGVAMRRMPEQARLATLVQQGADVGDHLRALARMLASFHSAAERGPAITAEASAVGLRRRWSDNLRETERYAGRLLSPAVHGEISHLAMRYIDGRQDWLNERAESGHAVDGHGDLTAEDIFCLPDHPRVLDCIEFDDRLRWLDVLDDLAFLAMDLERLDRPDLAEDLVSWYLEFSGEPARRSLQHHYVAYRAFVRAKVSCIQAAQGAPAAAADADRFARLSLDHLRAGEPTLTLVGGAPATGKTTLARGLADALGWVLLSADVIRRQLPVADGDRYTPGAKAGVYSELLARTRQALGHGESVVADATWGDARVRALALDVADQTCSRFVGLECHAPVELAAGRAQRRLRAGADASEAGARVARQQAAGRDPWPSAVGIDGATSPEAALAQGLVAVAPAHCAPPAGAARRRDVRPRRSRGTAG